MAIRPPRRGFSVSRAMSERARAAASPADVNGPDIAGFGGITGMVGALRGLVEQLAASAQRPAGDTGDLNSGTFTVGGKDARVVFGYTLRMGPDGVSAEPFGNVPPLDKPAEPAALQPITEVYQDGDAVVVIAELPGADPDRVVCRPDGTRLLIEATGARTYRKDLTLPVPVKADGMTQSVRNGILEVRLTRADVA